MKHFEIETSKIGATPSTNSANLQNRQRVAQLARRLFYFYPAQDVGNPEIFIAGVIELFERYPIEVLERAASAADGIPSKFKFIPRIAEIKDFLDGLLPKAPAPRTYPVFEKLPAPDKSARPTYGELQTRCHAVGLMIGNRGHTGFSSEETDQFRETWGITDEQWRAIPDAGR